MSTSDTPRTDSKRIAGHPALKEVEVAWSFARQLERELTAAQAALATTEHFDMNLIARCNPATMRLVYEALESCKTHYYGEQSFDHDKVARALAALDGRETP